MKTAPTRLFVGGVPTEPDVKKLIEAFQQLDAGTLISHADIELLLKTDFRSARYRVIVTAWRTALRRDRNIDTKAIPGVGIEVLGEYGRVEESFKDYRQGTRKVSKAVKRVSAARVELMEPAEQRIAGHARRVMEATLTEARRGARSIAIEFKTQERLPRGK